MHDSTAKGSCVGWGVPSRPRKQRTLMTQWHHVFIPLIIALSLSGVLLFVLWLTVRILRSKVSWLQDFYRRLSAKLNFFAVVLSVNVSLLIDDQTDILWWLIATRILLIVLILNGAWLLHAVVNFFVTRYIRAFEAGSAGTTASRRITTQLKLLNRLVNAAIWVIAAGLALFTFPQVQALGAGLMASAGIASLLVGLAAQSVLGNLFSGVQLAFSNAISVGDVVVVEGEWGKIGEFTLSYVVVEIWDGRTLVVPSTYFTSNPIEAWTRNSSQILATVELDLDWHINIQAVREEFSTFLTGTKLWDGRASNVVMTDATGGYVRVRLLASAANSDDQWDLRCLAREHMVTWMSETFPDSLPQSRMTLKTPEALTPRVSA